MSNEDQTPVSAENLKQWVDDLSDFDKRRQARQNLISAGAVDTLVACLRSENESVAWAAVQSLAEMKAQKAVEPLISMLELDILPYDVAEALMRITGCNYGISGSRWRAWFDETHQTVAEVIPENEVFSVDACVKETSELLGVTPDGGGNAYQFLLSLPSSRTQKVRVKFGQRDSTGNELVLIFSDCGPALPRHYERALRINVKLPSGAIGILDIEGEPHFVMMDALLASTIHPRQLAVSIETIAARADKMEQIMTNQDVH